MLLIHCIVLSSILRSRIQVQTRITSSLVLRTDQSTEYRAKIGAKYGVLRGYYARLAGAGAYPEQLLVSVLISISHHLNVVKQQVS